jgi:TRAP-type C4-dicarboxylate transport system substrate-binding protein
MRKRLYVFVTIASFVLSGTLAIGIDCYGKEATYHYKCVTSFKKGDFRGDTIEEWCRAVEGQSGGRIKIDYYPAEMLEKVRDYPTAISKGTIDLCYWVPVYYGGVVPLGTLWEINPYITSLKQLLSPRILKLLSKEARQKVNIVHLWYFPVGEAEWFFSKPVTSPEQMKGMLMRSATGIIGDYMKVYGAKEVKMPMSELYMAAQTKVVEGCFSGSIESYYSQKLYEVFPYMLRARLWPEISAMIAMNGDKWDALPPELQKIFLDTGKKAQEKIIRGVKRDEEALLKELLDKKLIKIHELDPKKRNEWNRLVEPAFRSAAEKLGPDGIELINALEEAGRR